MNLLEGMQKNNTIINTKGSEYYDTTYDANLDLFASLSRFDSEERILRIFDSAMEENKELALANLLYILDIRNGKGERRIFQIIFKNLCLYYPNEAKIILHFIGKLGRYDSILIGLDTPIEEEVFAIIQKQLTIDLKSDTPSLLSKWLPSHRCHGVNNEVAHKIMKGLGMKEKEYRTLLKTIRDKLHLVEKDLSTKNDSMIDFHLVPCKAMLKYKEAFQKRIPISFNEFKKEVRNGESKIHTSGLFAYEIIRKILNDEYSDKELYNLMWENQKNIFENHEKNLLVVADTSSSMLSCGAIPFATSVGLAFYIAERNKGFFHNHFITFSESPTLQEVRGRTIYDKVNNMREINVLNTDIDKVFDLILQVSIENHLSQVDLPEMILIISDMEFDRGVYSRTGTNFDGWKKAFQKKGYKLPSILFWNVAGTSKGVPVTKFDQDVAIVSGFSTNILENLLSIDAYSPINIMFKKLNHYLEMIK